MNQPRILTLGLLAAFVVSATAFTSSVRAQAAAPAPTGKIAVIDLGKAYRGLAETAAMNTELKALDQQLQGMNTSHKAQLNEMQTKITQAKADSEVHRTLMEDFDAKTLQFESEEKAIQIKAGRLRGHQMKHAYDAIQATVTEYAKKNGIDAVLVSSGSEVPDNVADIGNPEQLVNVIFNRSMMYVSPSVDITDKIIAAADLAAKAAPAPAPGH